MICIKIMLSILSQKLCIFLRKLTIVLQVISNKKLFHKIDLTNSNITDY